MYKQSLRLAFKFRILVIAVAALELGIQFLNEQLSLASGTSVARILLYLMLAYWVFSELILSKDNIAWSFRKDWMGFVWRGFLVSVIVYIPSTIVSAVVFQDAIKSISRNVAILESFIIGQIVFIILTPLILPLIGTTLPAYLNQQGTGLANAFHRGKKRYWKLFLQIITGPMLVHVVSSIVLFFASVAFGGYFINEAKELNILHMGAILIVELLNSYEVVMMVWILATAYLASIADPNLDKEIDKNEQT